MFEDILGEIQKIEQQAQQAIDKANEEKIIKLKKAKEEYEDRISKLHVFERELLEKTVEEMKKQGEQVADDLKKEFDKMVGEVISQSQAKKDVALSKLSEGLI